MGHTDHPKYWDNETRSKWLTENQRLIYRAIEPFRSTLISHDTTYEDLCQIASLSVIKAMNIYTPGSSKFSTFAVTVIRNDLTSCLRASRAKKRSGIVESLDSPSPFEEKNTKKGYINVDFSSVDTLNRYENSPLEILTRNELISVVKEAILILTPEEKYVTERIIAGWTQEDIANVFDCSQSKISTIFGNAKLKMHRELQKAGLE